jgi:hypothetical protein
MPEQKPWPNEFRNSSDVASACNWVRWKTRGGALLVLAIGANSVCAAVDEKLDAKDAIEILQVERDTIAALIRAIKQGKKTHHFIARMDR